MPIYARSILGIGFMALALALAIAAFFINLTTRPHDVPVVAEHPLSATPAAGTVAVALKDIKRGDKIPSDAVSSLQLSQPRPSEAFDKPVDVVGAIALEDFQAGQILVRSGVSFDKDIRPGLSALVPVGMRAVALRINDESAVGDFLRPDDIVDLELVIPADQLAKIRGDNVTNAGRPETRTLLQRIRILSVGEALTVTQDNHAIRMENLTVAVTPKQALLIGLGKQIGSFYLALRHPSDETTDKTSLTKVDDILGGNVASSTTAANAAATARNDTHQITIYQGQHVVHQDVP